MGPIAIFAQGKLKKKCSTVCLFLYHLSIGVVFIYFMQLLRKGHFLLVIKKQKCCQRDLLKWSMRSWWKMNLDLQGLQSTLLCILYCRFFFFCFHLSWSVLVPKFLFFLLCDVMVISWIKIIFCAYCLLHCSSLSGPIKEPISSSTVSEKKPFEPSIHITSQAQRDYSATHNYHPNHVVANVCVNLVLEIYDWIVIVSLILRMGLQNVSTASSRKPKVKKKSSDDFSSSVGPDAAELQGWIIWFFSFSIVFIYSLSFLWYAYEFFGVYLCSDATIGNFCELLEDFCGRAEILGDDRDESEWIAVPLSDLRIVINEITSIRAKKLLHLVPVDILVRLLRVLDHQIHRAEGLSIDEYEHVSLLSLCFCSA